MLSIMLNFVIKDIQQGFLFEKSIFQWWLLSFTVLVNIVLVLLTSKSGFVEPASIY